MSDKRNCDLPWEGNGIWWEYCDKIDVPCPNCENKELWREPFTYQIYKCKSCGHMTSEYILWRNRINK